MKQPINEIKRMQQLAGLIKENQEIDEAEKMPNLPNLDFEKLANILNKYSANSDREKKYFIDAIKTIDNYLSNRTEEEIGYKLKKMPSPKFVGKKQQIMKPLYDIFVDLMFADETINMKNTLISNYIEMAKFLNQIK